ncbi:hypothetical protein [Pelagibius sp.]|uniref:hypothetical protein n=1 Tax=Pelagibius sp. TaxID=1931238 RepID=UPI003B513ECB
MAQAAKPRKVVRTQRVGLKPWVKILVLILLFPFAALLLPTTLVFATMMAPTWVAYITDRSAEKHLAITVGLLNFSGTLPAIIDLWSRGQSHDAAMLLLTDVFVWAIAYGAAMVGWVIFAFMPSLVGSYFKMTTESRIKSLARQQKTLIDEWGHAVADGMALIPLDGEAEAGEAEMATEPSDAPEAEIVDPAFPR